jgi:hypothetical protein
MNAIFKILSVAWLIVGFLSMPAVKQASYQVAVESGHPERLTPYENC